MLHGIDVSHYQKNISWKQVNNAGYSFAILKAMYESNHKPDEYFEKNYKGCKENGLFPGVYDFVGSKNIENPEKDAKDLLAILGSRPLPMGIWIDCESDSLQAIGKQKITELIETEARIFKEAGYAVGIYCNLSWYNNVLDGKGLSKKYPFWIARYPSNDVGQPVEKLNPKSFAQAWQYSSKGKVPGINGNVDMDYFYISTSDLSKYSKPQVVDTLGVKTITANSLNIREKSSAISKSLGILKKDSSVTIDKIENGFAHFEGWISTKYLQ